MPDVTKILSQIEYGDPKAAEELLPLVYEELRKLAAVKMAQEKPGQTLQATALVHDAYIRLVDVEKVRQWNSRGHFFGAAAEAMRRILVDNARRKGTGSARGRRTQVQLVESDAVALSPDHDWLDFNDALCKLEERDHRLAEVVKLRVFSGLTFEEVAECTGVSARTAKRDWTYARAWIGRELGTLE